MTPRTIYRVQMLNGRFFHTYGKRSALERAAEAMGEVDVKFFSKHYHEEYGITITRLTKAQAAAVGMHSSTSSRPCGPCV